MADQEKWELSREEIEARLKELGQKKPEKTRGGRSSGQGVKLLYIRDYQTGKSDLPGCRKTSIKTAGQA